MPYQLRLDDLIAIHVLIDLSPPEFRPRCGKFEHRACVAVPEAPMYKDNSVKAWKYQIRATGQILHVKSKPQPPPVKPSPQQHLGLSITAADATHIEPALFGSQNIDHAQWSLPGAAATDHRRRLRLMW
jgi:hypothetical protein